MLQRYKKKKVNPNVLVEIYQEKIAEGIVLSAIVIDRV
jgi:hypothetical protein